MKNQLILVADDDPEDLELIGSAFSSIDTAIKVHTVANGKEIIEYLDSRVNYELPCLIVLDYNMSEITGLEVLIQINKKKEYYRIPKIILSTSNSPQHKQDCILNGATDYFVKPNNMNDLNKLAKKMLEYCAS